MCETGFSSVAPALLLPRSNWRSFGLAFVEWACYNARSLPGPNVHCQQEDIMDEDVGAQKDDQEVMEPGAPGLEEVPEPGTAAREEPTDIAEEAMHAAAEGIEQVREAASEVGAEAEAAQAQVEAAGEGMSDLVDETRAAGAELGEDLERAAVAAHAGVAGATREVSGVAAEIRETADDVVRATRERIAVAEERSMAPEYHGISFSDGFRFGCGFTVAGCLFWLILSIILAAIPLALSALNVIGLPGR